MVDSNELSIGLKNICEILSTNEIPYCLVGGLAVSMLAAPRATEDIDLMVLLSDKQKAKIASLLENKFEIIQNKEYNGLIKLDTLKQAIQSAQKKQK